jgi:uncharacterized membrane protein
MGIVSDYVVILPATTFVGWVLSWWGPQQVRWWVLSIAVAISVICVVIGFGTDGPPATPGPVCCDPVTEYVDPPSIIWFAAGLIEFTCSVVLMFVTVVAELILIGRARRRSAR